MEQQIVQEAEARVQRRATVPRVDRDARWLARHWLFLANLAFGVFAAGTLLAPLLMRLRLIGPAWMVYRFYSFFCHQLPERSYFLFGPHGVDTYSRVQVLAWGADPGYLRGFIGNPQVGFKVGIAERDLAIYIMLVVAGLSYALVRRRIHGLSWRWFLLLILPMALDGGSHVVSEVTGFGSRESNVWLAALTGNAFSQAFYAGTTIGSYNWLMRTITGSLFAVACVWFAYPYLEQGFGDVVRPARMGRVPGTGNGSQAERRVKPEETTP